MSKVAANPRRRAKYQHNFPQKADKEIYQIIEEVEGRVFGQSSPFTINTPYLDHAAEEIKPEEIISQCQETLEKTLSIEEAFD
ncbi:MAG: hypothetical protein M2R46_03116 [Verrucomicrobia subdivision 3 bacterium]|nr:hypothetical protein [Limisphaerales bacterium]